MPSARHWLVVLLLLGLACKRASREPAVDLDAASAQDSAADAAATVAPAALEKAFLWKVHGKGDAEPVYLLGTIHVAITANRLPRAVFEAFDACERVVVELDMETAAEPLEAAMKLPPGETLEMTDEEWLRVAELSGLTVEKAKEHRAWYLVSLIVQRMAPVVLVPIDLVVWIRAGSRGQQRDALETVHEQLAAMEKGLTVPMLREYIESPERQAQIMASMIAAYEARDTEQLAAVALDPEQLEKYPQELAALLGDRNRAWMPKIEAWVKEGDVCIAAGAGHFVGPDGIVSMLRERGYEVTLVD